MSGLDVRRSQKKRRWGEHIYAKLRIDLFFSIF